MPRNRHNGSISNGRRKVARKSDEEWAVLAVPAPKLAKRLADKGISVRQAADLCGHASHSHIWRLLKGQVKTTSVHTADVLEAITDSRDLLFARTSARTGNRVAA